MVRLLMAQNVMPSLKNRTRSLDCPKCSMAVFATGTAAYSPSSEQKCSHCGHEFPTPGRIRKIIANPLIGMLAKLAKDAPRTPRQHDLQLLPETL
jgi:DNA-directed RNA polymerase subunit RPC12/RpoP